MDTFLYLQEYEITLNNGLMYENYSYTLPK